MAKQYGLIVPNKDKVVIQRPSIFDDSDSEESVPTGLKRTLKRQDKIVRDKAIEEDPTVYQYDEVYDEIDKKRKEAKLSRTDLSRKPKYINRLLAAADRRKRENERRIERQVQKERETEGDEFKDKESFVTTSYKKKLEEMKEMEEQEKREEYLESIGDVTKQGNLDGFYRHLYDQKVNYNEDKIEVKKDKTEVEKDKNEEHVDDEKQKAKPRKYRKYDDSNSEEDTTQQKETVKEHIPSNIDADSDFSIDSSESEEEEEEEGEVDKEVTEEKQATHAESEEPVKTNETVDEPKETVKVEETVEVEEPIPEKKLKIDIWKKRTVGEVFDAALQRYFERKAVREL